jgi:hypothetical protein
MILNIKLRKLYVYIQKFLFKPKATVSFAKSYGRNKNQIIYPENILIIFS